MSTWQMAAALTIVLAAAPARAQTAPVGVRAAGMGGAFTAVADDATATYWNPAGLAAGTFFGLTIDANDFDRQGGRFAGFATPPFGISYFRTSSSTGATANGRNPSGGSFVVHHAGVTLVQSVGDHGLAAGTTLGIVRGNGETAFGADAGVMLAGAFGKLGLVAHNLTAPTLGNVRLDRQLRAGVSVNARENLLVAADVDLTSTRLDGKPRQDAAVGVEAHPQGHVWVRGGMHWSVRDTAAPIGTAGASVAFYGSLRADAQVSFGSQDGDRGWGVGLSFVY
jgi:hypothetical protein